jgi:hypothetical protein
MHCHCVVCIVANGSRSLTRLPALMDLCHLPARDASLFLAFCHLGWKVCSEKTVRYPGKQRNIPYARENWCNRGPPALLLQTAHQHHVWHVAFRFESRKRHPHNTACRPGRGTAACSAGLPELPREKDSMLGRDGGMHPVPDTFEALRLRTAWREQAVVEAAPERGEPATTGFSRRRRRPWRVAEHKSEAVE